MESNIKRNTLRINILRLMKPILRSSTTYLFFLCLSLWSIPFPSSFAMASSFYHYEIWEPFRRKTPLRKSKYRSQDCLGVVSFETVELNWNGDEEVKHSLAGGERGDIITSESSNKVWSWESVAISNSHLEFLSHVVYLPEEMPMVLSRW